MEPHKTDFTANICCDLPLTDLCVAMGEDEMVTLKKRSAAVLASSGLVPTRLMFSNYLYQKNFLPQ